MMESDFDPVLTALPVGTSGEAANAMEPETVLWRERERRQRTIRLLMMFLLVLMLMDGEENGNSPHVRKRRRFRSAAHNRIPLEEEVFSSRQVQESRIRDITRSHPRYHDLISKNRGVDYEQSILEWVEQHAALEKDLFPAEEEMQPKGASSASSSSSSSSSSLSNTPHDPDEDRKVWHYPWNSTGFYRGEWQQVLVRNESMAPANTNPSHNAFNLSSTPVEPILLERSAKQVLRRNFRNEGVAVVILPNQTKVKMRDDNNLTAMHWEYLRTDSKNAIVSIDRGLYQVDEKQAPPSITLIHDSGRVAFQFFARSIPSMQELSLVEGFVKIYDSVTPGYSTRKDILLRVRGVMIHAIGRLSLVSTTDVAQGVLVVNPDSTKNGGSAGSDAAGNDGTTATQRRRRLQEALKQPKKMSTMDVKTIREDALALFADEVQNQPYRLIVSSGELPYEDDLGKVSQSVESPEPLAGNQEDIDTVSRGSTEPAEIREEQEASRSLKGTVEGSKSQHSVSSITVESSRAIGKQAHRALEGTMEGRKSSRSVSSSTSIIQSGSAPEGISTKGSLSSTWSDIVIPFPFVRDDSKETVRRTKTPASRLMPPREQALEANAAGCGFEINLDVGSVEWTIGAWRKLVSRMVMERKRLDPASRIDGESDNDQGDDILFLRGSRPKAIQDQSLVSNIMGTIHSANCAFTATINATALRTDWEATTSRAINYSFVMMLVCLTQILILLRQLLHSQGQSAASRVSILCIGWQALLDALLCLSHIYLSLSIQPLFSAFASVSFFKLLIFCVIEMKYMAMIIQSRNSNSGNQTAESLRRQIALLHLRFYTALTGSFLLIFYIGEKNRIFYILALYSFWVPQIVLNVITEAKNPMHPYYIYGMSFSRMVAPLYIFGVRNNFLKEVYPEAPYDPFTCQMLVIWMCVQTALLVGQSKYGARFMIPARFLPPKFDYSRPIPASMLPPGAMEMIARECTRECIEDREDPALEAQALTVSYASPRGRHKTAITTRNRIRGRVSRSRPSERGMTEEAMGGTLVSSSNTPSSAPETVPTLDCSICYEAIDIRKRRDYMLAPCNHLFHRECLVQWMDVKMECPVCRTELPAL